MYAIAHGGCTVIVRESALKVRRRDPVVFQIVLVVSTHL